MESSQSDPGYISYHDYPEVKRQFDRMIDIRNDKTRFEEIINTISGVPKTPKFRDNVLTILHKVLSNDPAFMGNIGDNYCRYINFWLNKEIQDADDHLKKSYFDIFVKFSDKFFLKRTNIKNNPCKNYIFNLDNETTNIMRILYGLYDEYKKIKSYSKGNYSTSCDYLLYLASNHNSAIDKYYEKDQNLYKKFEQIKKLIDKLTKHSSSPCTQDIYLNSPKEVIRLEEEAKKRAAEQEEQERQETLRKQREEALRTQRQQQLKSKEELLQRPENNNVGDTASERGTSQHLGDRGGLPASTISESGLNRQILDSSEWPESPRGLLSQKDHTREGPFIYTNEETGPLGEVYDQNGPDRTRTGTFGGSTGFPGYITEVFRSVEPAPILGVSGGMGALFLLFKYTPVGSFFGGRRRRFHQIPSSFGGFPTGDFANFQEYSGGYVGYSPMDINPLAE